MGFSRYLSIDGGHLREHFADFAEAWFGDRNININFRVSQNVAIMLIATPSKVSFIPLARTSRSTSNCLAPNAMRTPISCLRWATKYEITP